MAQQNDRYAGYISVAERIGQFHADWPTGRVLTAVVEHDAERGSILFRAEVYRELAEETPSATGHAYEVKAAMPGHMQASYVEVCESSAVGRALMLLGYETKRTGEEAKPRAMAAAASQGPRSVPTQPPDGVSPDRPRILRISEIADPESKMVDDLVTKEQLVRIKAEALKASVDADEECNRVFRIKTHDLSRTAAVAFIKHLMDGAPDVPA